MSFYRLKLQTLWLVDIPNMLLAAALLLIVGLIPGYLYGGRLKQRIESLTESAYHYERGNFTHRVADSLILANDEIGLMGGHLNEMAKHVERQVASLQKLSSEKSAMADQLKNAAVLEERQRIARDLHDAVSQQLFAISMMTSALQESADLNTDKVRKRIATVQALAGEAQNEMRALLMQLRPAALEGKGLKEGVEELLQRYADKHDTDIRWELEDITGVSKGVMDHLFRILQESMSNVFRHSQASSVIVKLNQANRQIHLKVTDNGTGFDKEAIQTSSYGMKTLKERAIEIGGITEVLSVPGKGTQIHVKIPVVDPEEEF
jgi:NarL family two-component system sensor histidine kinase LiaS